MDLGAAEEHGTNWSSLVERPARRPSAPDTGSSACANACPPSTVGSRPDRRARAPGGWQPASLTPPPPNRTASAHDPRNIVDDDALVRLGLADLLEDDPGIDVVAQAADGLQAVEQATAHRIEVAARRCAHAPHGRLHRHHRPTGPAPPPRR